MNKKEEKVTNKILVTGGAGFIGSHLCERLLQKGHNVVSLDDYSTGTIENHVVGVEYCTGHTCNIADFMLDDIDIIYHLGEYSRVEQSFDEIETVVASNVIGTKAVLEFWRKRGCKLVYAGSSTKFADGGDGRNQSPYAWTKAANTELVCNYGRWFSLPYAIAYFYNVYGPGERGDSRTGTVIGIFREQHQRGAPLTVRAPGTQRRNFTHVHDIVEGLVLVGDCGSGDEYGLGHPDSYSIREIAEMFGGPINVIPARSGNRMESQIDIRRAHLELGWTPQYALPDYIKSLTHD